MAALLSATPSSLTFLQVNRLMPVLDTKSVSQICPRRVIKLDVAAACCVQVGDHRAISGCNGVGKFLIGLYRQRRLSCWPSQRSSVTSENVWIGAGMVCRTTWPSPSSALTNFKVLDERVVLAADGTGHHGGIGRGLLVVEHIARTRGTAFNAIEPPHKVEVPVAAAELAIGNHLQASGLLLVHQVANGIILDGLKAVEASAARDIGGTGVVLTACGRRKLPTISARETARSVESKCS